jgi:AcrR family transcriptional regulator
MPKGFSAEEKAQIADQLLAAGREQFTAHGLHKVSVDELVAAVGISKGAFYGFYPSKEALFMEVVEQAEVDFRQAVLAQVETPGPSPRMRFYALLRHAFTVWKTIPLLQAFTRGEYDQLLRRLPAAQLQSHLQSDRVFVVELIARCRRAGIPLQVDAETLGGLLYALFFTSLHEDDFDPQRLTHALETLLELVAALCVGELVLHAAGQATTQGRDHAPSH